MRFISYLAIALVTLVAGDAALAAPQGLPDRPLDVELRGTDAKNVLRLLADASGRKITIDPCVDGKVDLRLKNVPVALVFDALATKLGLVYDDEGTTIAVRCARGADPRTTARVSLAENDAALEEVLARLAAQAQLDGVDYRATAKPRVNVTLANVQLRNVVSVIADESGLGIYIARGRIVVVD